MLFPCLKKMTLLWHQTIDQCLCCVVKLWKDMYNCLHCNNLFYEYQAGFLPGHSTVYQLIEMYHNIVKVLMRESPDVLFSVTNLKHLIEFGIKGLLFKLETYGTSGGHLDWLNSYLCNRTQNVMYKLRHFIIYFLYKSRCTPGFNFKTSDFFIVRKLCL